MGLLGVLYYAVRQRQRIAEAEGDEDGDERSLLPPGPMSPPAAPPPGPDPGDCPAG
ncbi:MAG: hypothetical protein IPO15_14805 [Anaerolineae bacterium]|uniref:hypothetical protein n=1 Tax=Candidatus Amarolinea dominans TaxID=3140696 RepID=UPI003136CE4D|nr:hypothetical protein [Anaerolineae bacterium]